MDQLTLRYQEDPATGLPKLEDLSGSLSAGDLERLRRELDRQFERLASGPTGQILTVNGSADASSPRHFRVTITSRDKRCPTLLLEAVAPPPEVVGTALPAENPVPTFSPPSLGRWQNEFLAEAAELLADGTSDAAGRSPLDFVLTDLRALRRKDPRKLTLLLLAGYLYVGDTLSRKHGEGGDNPYVQAAGALTQLAGKSLPAGVLESLLGP